MWKNSVINLCKGIVTFRERETKTRSTIAQLESLKESAVARENEKHEKLQTQLERAAQLKKELNKLKGATVARDDLEREIRFFLKVLNCFK